MVKFSHKMRHLYNCRMVLGISVANRNLIRTCIYKTNKFGVRLKCAALKSLLTAHHDSVDCCYVYAERLILI